MTKALRESLLVLLSLLATGLAARAEIPSTLLADGLTVFVRSDSALGPDGQVDTSLFSEADASAIRLYMILPEEKGCVRLRGLIRFYPNLGPLGSLKEAADAARFVVHGTVVAQAPGFSASEAGTLVELQADEVLKGARRGPSRYFAFFPVGTFTMGDRNYCAFNPDWPRLPETGDRLLLFIRRELPNSDYLPLLDGTDVIVLGKGAAELPPRYTAERSHKGLGPEAVLERVRAYVESEKGAALLEQSI